MIITPAVKSGMYHTEVVHRICVSENMYWYATEEDTQVLQIHHSNFQYILSVNTINI